MTIILDFDDVLFDAIAFKKELAAIFKKYKVDFQGTYERAKKPKGIYSFKKHLALIRKTDINIRRIEKDVNKIDFKKFLFPDVLDFLEVFKDHNLILLSRGDKEFQKIKIYGLGREFVSFFDKIIAEPIEKVKILKKILRSYKSRPVIFIDNSEKELENIKDEFKDVILIKINRNKGESLWQIKDRINQKT